MSDVPDPPKGLFEQRQFPDAPAANDVVKFPDRPPQQFIDDDNEENIEFPTDIPDMDAIESFPEAPPLDEDSSTFTFPEAPKDDPLTTIITNSTKSHENVDVDALEQRLKKLHPNTSFTSKPTVLPLSSKPETAEDLLKRYTEEANIEKKFQTKDKPVVVDNDRLPEDDRVAALLKQVAGETDKHEEESAPGDTAFDETVESLLRQASLSNRDKQKSETKKKYHSKKAKNNSRIARQLIREAIEAGIDPKTLDIAQHIAEENDLNPPLSDSDDFDDDDDSSMSLADDDSY